MKFFLSSWPTLFWGAITFSFLISFRQLLVSQMHQEERFKFCLDTRNNGALPLDPPCHERLNVQSPVSLFYTSERFTLTLLTCIYKSVRLRVFQVSMPAQLHLPPKSKIRTGEPVFFSWSFWYFKWMAFMMTKWESLWLETRHHQHTGPANR